MRRRLIIIGSALLIIVGVSVVIILAVNRSPKLQNVVNSLAGSKTSNTNTFVTNSASTNTPTVTPDRTAITYVARNFTERFGSGSTENGGSNLVTAEEYGTASYNDYLNGQITQLNAHPATTYSGTVTRALAFNLLKLTDTTASIVVSTTQTTTTQSTSDTKNRDLLVDLVKVGGDWKVNAAAWK